MSNARRFAHLAFTLGVIFAFVPLASAAPSHGVHHRHHGVWRATGALRIENHTRVPLAVRVDRHPVRVIGPHASLLLARVPAGRHRIVARPAGVHRRRHAARLVRTAWVPPGRPAVVVLAPPRWRLRVRNPERVPVRVVVDGTVRAELSPGQAAVLELQPGTHRVALASRFGRLSETVLHGAAGQHRAWLPAPRATSIVVEGPSSRAATVTVDGIAAGTVPPGGARRVDGLPPGPHRIELI